MNATAFIRPLMKETMKAERINKVSANKNTSESHNKIVKPLEITIRTFLEHNSVNNKEYIKVWDILKEHIDSEISERLRNRGNGHTTRRLDDNSLTEEK